MGELPINLWQTTDGQAHSHGRHQSVKTKNILESMKYSVLTLFPKRILELQSQSPVLVFTGIYPLLDPETLKCQSYLLANFWVFLLLPQTAARLCSFSTSLANHEKRVYFHSWQVRIAYFLTEYVVKFCVTATNKHLPLLLWAAVLPELCTNGIKRRPISSPLSMEGAADCRSCLSWGGTCISWISFWESEVCKESLTSPNWRGSGNGLLFSEQSVFG